LGAGCGSRRWRPRRRLPGCPEQLATRIAIRAIFLAGKTPANGKSAETTAAKGEASAEKLLDAAVHVIRSKGYSAARVVDICAEAGLTKGAFFASKETCAVAVAAHFAARADAIFDAAPYSRCPIPAPAC
jgi:Bacterial regulatory proteins, tetR family